jgi:hypothetical protein
MKATLYSLTVIIICWTKLLLPLGLADHNPIGGMMISRTTNKELLGNKKKDG